MTQPISHKRPLEQTPIKGCLVEDNEMQRSIALKKVEQVFKKLERTYDMKGAFDGKQGWELCETNSFDFYIIDYQMPQMNGAKLIRKILDKYPQAPIILYSETRIETIEDDERKEGVFFEKSLHEVAKYVKKQSNDLSVELEKLFVEPNKKSKPQKASIDFTDLVYEEHDTDSTTDDEKTLDLQVKLKQVKEASTKIKEEVLKENPAALEDVSAVEIKPKPKGWNQCVLV